MTDNAWWPRRIQGAYYVVTGLWPVVATEHYMRATGQESHAGVARALGGAVAALGVALALDLIPRRPARWVGIGSALLLGSGGAYFAARGRGVPTNATDTAMQLAFAISWIARGKPAA